MHPFFNTAVFSHRNRTWVLGIIIYMLFGQGFTLGAATRRWGNSLRTAARTAMQAAGQTPSTERQAHAMVRDLMNPFGQGSRSQSNGNSSKFKTWSRTGAGLLLAAAAGGYATEQSIEQKNLTPVLPRRRQTLSSGEVAYYLEDNHILEMSSYDMEALIDTCYDQHTHKPTAEFHPLMVRITNLLLADDVLLKINPKTLWTAVNYLYLIADENSQKLCSLMEKICSLDIPQKAPETFLAFLEAHRLMSIGQQLHIHHSSTVMRPLANYVTPERLRTLPSHVSGRIFTEIHGLLPTDRRRAALALLPIFSSGTHRPTSEADVAQFMRCVSPSSHDNPSEQDQTIARLLFSIACEPGRFSTLPAEFLNCMGDFAPCLRKEERPALISHLMHVWWEQDAIYHVKPQVVTTILEQAPGHAIQDFLSKIQDAQVLHPLNPSYLPTALKRLHSLGNRKQFSDSLEPVLRLLASPPQLVTQHPHLIVSSIALIKDLPPCEHYRHLEPFVTALSKSDILQATDPAVTVAVIEHIKQLPSQEERTRATYALLQTFTHHKTNDTPVTRALLGTIAYLDASITNNLVQLLDRTHIHSQTTPSASEQQLRQFMRRVPHEEKEIFLKNTVGDCLTILPEVLEYVRQEEAAGRIMGFHGNHDHFALLRDVFTRLHSITTETAIPDTFRFFRFDRSDRRRDEELNLANQITSSWTPNNWRKDLLFFTLSLFASRGGSSPLDYAVSNVDQSCLSPEMPTLRSLFDQLGIPKLGESLEREGLLKKLQQDHTKALGNKGSLVTLSMTPQFTSSHAYAAMSGGVRVRYKYWWSRWLPLFSTNTATLAQAMKREGAGGLLFEEHCLVIPDALTNPEHAHQGNLRVREFYPGLNKDAWKAYEETRNEILFRVACALRFPEGIPSNLQGQRASSTTQ